MKFYFWQNIISPHQTDLLTELKKSYDVILITEKSNEKIREDMGWKADKSGLNVIISPSYHQIEYIIQCSKNEDVHVFSGMHTYKLVSFAFNKALKLRKRIYIYSEAVRTEGLKGKIKILRGIYHSLKYRNRIEGVLAIGKTGVNWFERIGIHEEKIIPFGYFISIDEKLYQKIESNEFRLIFVGRLVEYKGIILVLNALKLILDEKILNVKLTIIGDGPLRDKVVNYINENDLGLSINLYGYKNKEFIFSEINKSSLLVLPNTKLEGWGVVINEALMLGTPVICTEKTGSSCVVEYDFMFGKVINSNNIRELKGAIGKCLMLKETFRSEIISKANSLISPEKAIKYFISVVNKSSEIECPWLEKK